MSSRGISNFKFNMSSYGDEDLSTTIKLLMKGTRVSGFTVTSSLNQLFLTLYQHSEKAIALPAELDADAVILLVQAWLLQADYGTPLSEGACTRGFEISDAEGVPQGVFQISPLWVFYEE